MSPCTSTTTSLEASVSQESLSITTVVSEQLKAAHTTHATNKSNAIKNNHNKRKQQIDVKAEHANTKVNKQRNKQTNILRN